jgi:hypothetical protein
MCFAWISEQTAIISLYGINVPVFINEARVFTARYGLGLQISYSFVLKVLMSEQVVVHILTTLILVVNIIFNVY